MLRNRDELDRLRPTTRPAHLKLVYARDESKISDRWRETADAYVVAFRELVDDFLSFERIDGYQIESSFAVACGRPCLDITVRQASEDPIASTKIFGAVNATKTYLRLKMDSIRLGAEDTWADVLVRVDFAEPELRQHR
jgi:hypothetical protein